MNYVKQNSSWNINNLTEEIKEKRKSLELSDEINPNDIPKINNEKENKEEKIENNNDDLNKIYNEIKNNSILNIYWNLLNIIYILFINGTWI